MKLKKKLFTLLATLSPKGVNSIILERYGIRQNCRISYSQEGEDLILELIFGGKKNGFYVDIGAHHPTKFSNTYKFYENGWTGINIDAAPGFLALFNSNRGKDINIQCAISDKSGEEVFYIFNDPALNTLSLSEAEKILNEGKYHIVDQIRVKTMTINEILSQHIPADKEIDFLTIDIEGLDRRVILDLDFDRFRPEVILFEDHGFLVDGANEITTHMNKNGYSFFSKTMRTVFFRKKI